MPKSDDKNFVTVRCSPEQRKEADRIATEVKGRYPVVTRAQVLRRALEIGIEALKQNPKALMSA